MAPQHQSEGAERPRAYTDASGDVGAGAPDPRTGEGRAAERAALRAEAVAAAEDFHPLRVRPYVAASPPGEAPDAPTTSVLFPEPPDLPDPGTDADAAWLSGEPYETGASFPYGHEAEPAEAAAARGRHRRRRRRIVVAAAAVAATTLAAGAVAVTGRVMGGEQGGTDLAQPDQTSSVPDVTLPTDTDTDTGTATRSAPPVTATGRTHSSVTTAPSPSASPSRTTRPVATVSPVASATPPTPTGSASPTATATGAPPSDSPAPPPVLRLGDSGPQVADMQRRLAGVWVYHGRADGTFDHNTQHAVAQFQIWHGITGDPSGVYGPHTRAALEQATPPVSH